MTDKNKEKLLKLQQELVTKGLCDAFLGYAVVNFIENWNEEREKENDICKGEEQMTINDNAKYYDATPKLGTPIMSKIDRHLLLCTSLNDIYARKNHDYGDSFHETFVEEGLAMSRIRLADKFQRFKTLSKKVDMTGEVADESIMDTLMDLANYSLMTVLEIQLKNEELERKQDLL